MSMEKKNSHLDLVAYPFLLTHSGLWTKIGGGQLMIMRMEISYLYPRSLSGSIISQPATMKSSIKLER